MPYPINIVYSWLGINIWFKIWYTNHALIWIQWNQYKYHVLKHFYTFYAGIKPFKYYTKVVSLPFPILRTSPPLLDPPWRNPYSYETWFRFYDEKKFEKLNKTLRYNVRDKIKFTKELSLCQFSNPYIFANYVVDLWYFKLKLFGIKDIG